MKKAAALPQRERSKKRGRNAFRPRFLRRPLSVVLLYAAGAQQPIDLDLVIAQFLQDLHGVLPQEPG